MCTQYHSRLSNGITETSAREGWITGREYVIASFVQNGLHNLKPVETQPLEILNWTFFAAHFLLTTWMKKKRNFSKPQIQFKRLNKHSITANLNLEKVSQSLQRMHFSDSNVSLRTWPCQRSLLFFPSRVHTFFHESRECKNPYLQLFRIQTNKTWQWAEGERLHSSLYIHSVYERVLYLEKTKERREGMISLWLQHLFYDRNFPCGLFDRPFFSHLQLFFPSLNTSSFPFSKRKIYNRFASMSIELNRIRGNNFFI